jgi:hypothetical protein
MIQWQIIQPLSKTNDGRRWPRLCVIAILALSVFDALVLPTGAMSSMSTFDAFRYLAGADSILASGTYLDISGAPQSHWPPGTSIVYAAAASLSGRPPEELVKFVNLVALLLTAGSLWLIIEITIERWWIAIITFASIVLNTAILSLHNQLWSEPLALATSSAAIASGIVASRGGKYWYGWICAASVFLSIAICIRYAMLPGIPILATVAFWLSKRTASHREAVLLPLLSPLVTLMSFYFLRSTDPYSVRYVAFTSNDFYWDWPVFVRLTNQVFPVVLGATWLSVGIVTVCLIVVPAGVAFLPGLPQKGHALLICVGYALLSLMFLVIVPAAFHFATELRYLLQVYPIILIGAAIAADLLLNWQRLDFRILGFIVVGLLGTAAARSTRAALLLVQESQQQGSQQSASCVSPLALLDDLKRISATQNASVVLTNIQGLAWYAMRIPTIALTRSALEHAPSGTIIIYARPGYTCSAVVESQDIDESALTPAIDVSSVSSSDGLLIGKSSRGVGR